MERREGKACFMSEGIRVMYAEDREGQDGVAVLLSERRPDSLWTLRTIKIGYRW